MKKGFKLFAFTILMFCAISAFADSFSLKNTKTSILYGPFEKISGTRFKIENKDFCIMSARPGQILFANYPVTTYHGPYNFKHGQLINFDDASFEIIIDSLNTPKVETEQKNSTNISHVEIKKETTIKDKKFAVSIQKPKAQKIEEVKTNKSDIIIAEPITSKTNPVSIIEPAISKSGSVKIVDSPKLKKRELAPIPSTNPANFKDPEPFNFKMETNHKSSTINLWVEPVNSSKYNWKIGSFNGEKNSEIERKRIGISANYNGWFAEAAYSISGKSSGKLVPDGSTLSDLKLDGGKGYMFRGGYNYRFTIDGKWNGSFKAVFEYAKEDYDLTATAFQQVHNSYQDIYDDEGNLIENAEEDKPLISFGYVDTTSSISISEKTLSFGFGIDRTADTWGIGFDLGFVAYSDLSSSGSVTVGLNEYKLEAERSHPIICEFNGWYEPFDYLYIFGEFYLGSDTGLRLGVGKEF